jgi:hypothetical protein
MVSNIENQLSSGLSTTMDKSQKTISSQCFHFIYHLIRAMKLWGSRAKSEINQGQQIFLCSKASKLAPGLTQPYIQWVMELSSRNIKLNTRLSLVHGIFS